MIAYPAPLSGGVSFNKEVNRTTSWYGIAAAQNSRSGWTDRKSDTPPGARCSGVSLWDLLGRRVPLALDVGVGRHDSAVLSADVSAKSGMMSAFECHIVPRCMLV